MCSQEIPLMQFGGINTGRYIAGATPETTHIYGWPMNNYWTTNFNAEQHGGHSWTYTISGSDNNTQAAATQFGWGNRIPFLTRVLPGGGQGDNNWSGSFITGWPENVLVVSSFPGENGKSATFHLREIAGKNVSINLKDNISGNLLKLQQVNVLGEEIENGSTEINAFESKFFKVEF